MAWHDHEYGSKARKEAARHHRNRTKLARRFNDEEELLAPLYPEAMSDTPAPNDPGHALSEPPITVPDPNAHDPFSPTAAEVAQAHLEAKEEAVDELDEAVVRAREAQQAAIQAKADFDAAADEADAAYDEAIAEATAAYDEAVAADEAEDAAPPVEEPPVEDVPPVEPVPATTVEQEASQEAALDDLATRLSADEAAEAARDAQAERDAQPPVEA